MKQLFSGKAELWSLKEWKRIGCDQHKVYLSVSGLCENPALGIKAQKAGFFLGTGKSDWGR